MKIFYHQSDLDGHCSGAIVKKFLNAGELVGINYGQPFPWDSIEQNELVWMVDFSLQPFEDMVRLANLASLVWIDHHKTAIDEAIDRHVNLAIPGLRAVGLAGCELTWKYIQNTVMRDLQIKEAMPLAVHHIGRHDVWDHSDPDTLPFQYGLRLFDTRPDNDSLWVDLLCGGEYESPAIASIIEKGRTLLEYETRQNATYAKSAAFDVMLDGLKCVAVNRLFSNSKLFDSVWDPRKYDAMIAFGFRGGRWTVSLYSDRDDIDVGDVAKRRGGGGHKGAAGFQCSTPPFFPRVSLEEAINP